MQVHLLNFTPKPELLCAAAANLCYSDISASDILQNMSKNKIIRLLDKVLLSGHHSVIEHITFTFAIDGVSRILTHQLVRHRVGIALSQQSQRYTSMNKASYVTPKTISNKPGLLSKYKKLMESCLAFYKELQDHDVPNEDARFILPQSLETRIVMTTNMRQLIHMYSVNACFRSQWEFRQLMHEIKKELKRISFKLASELKIKCFSTGYCSERSICKELEMKIPKKEDLINQNQSINQDYYEELEKQIDESY